ncbi:class I SAM-dependent methyltransferase [Chitinimonas koreensis]|uniref:class I SAM-dependent methyltransferase n=1 Tax=Chitinimonas koreensis TaxID=356302 RepID=UPI00040B289F|nr:class I SAM-dependent methyltransferase [Chitinimonas koreensis]QNM96179.1 class I SAM-dependent methyltransferase [Chitinimonas koreensis]
MAIYSDAVFHVNNLEEARRIILTPERGLDTDSRWASETPWLRDQMVAAFPEHGFVLDFGCGVGRLAKAWLDARPAGRVLGVDLSREMRQLAPGYVEHDRFAACAPGFFQALLADGLRFDGAVACWIIQHVFDPAGEIERLHAALKPGGRLMVVNNNRRAVPTDRGWVDDGFDVAAALAARFEVEALGRLPVDASSEHISSNTFIGVYRRRAEPA